MFNILKCINLSLSHIHTGCSRNVGQSQWAGQRSLLFWLHWERYGEFQGKEIHHNIPEFSKEICLFQMFTHLAVWLNRFSGSPWLESHSTVRRETCQRSGIVWVWRPKRCVGWLRRRDRWAFGLILTEAAPTMHLKHYALEMQLQIQ